MKYIRLHQNLHLNEDFIDDFDDFDNGVSSMDNVISNTVSGSTFETYKFYIMFFISLMLKCSKYYDTNVIRDYMAELSDKNPWNAQWLKEIYKNPDFENKKNNELWKVDKLIRKNKAEIGSVVDNFFKCLAEMGLSDIFDPFSCTFCNYSDFAIDSTESKLNLSYDNYFRYSDNTIVDFPADEKYYSIDNKFGTINVNLILGHKYGNALGYTWFYHQAYDALEYEKNMNWISQFDFIQCNPELLKNCYYEFYINDHTYDQLINSDLNNLKLNPSVQHFQKATNDFESIVNKYLAPITLESKSTPIKFKFILKKRIKNSREYAKKQLNSLKTYNKFTEELFRPGILNISVNKSGWPGCNLFVIEDFAKFLDLLPENFGDLIKDKKGLIK